MAHGPFFWAGEIRDPVALLLRLAARRRRAGPGPVVLYSRYSCPGCRLGSAERLFRLHRMVLLRVVDDDDELPPARTAAQLAEICRC